MYILLLVIPAGTLQLTSQGEGIHTLTMTNSTTAGGTIVQYTQGQDGEFYVPGEIGTCHSTTNSSYTCLNPFNIPSPSTNLIGRMNMFFFYLFTTIFLMYYVCKYDDCAIEMNGSVLFI